MRGQSGIGTIIVFIAMILAAVVVAVVILQITDSLRGQAMLTERQARDTMSARFVIERVEGIAYKDANTEDYKLYYLILRVKTGVGTESLDFKKAALTYSAPGYTIPGAQYLPITKHIQGDAEAGLLGAKQIMLDATDLSADSAKLDSIQGACTAEMYDVMTALGKFDLQTITPYIGPIQQTFILNHSPGTPVTRADVAANRDPTKFTVVWENCDGKDDIYTLSDGQTAYVIYPLPEPVPSSTYITIDLYVADGWSNPMKIRVPAGLDKGYVLIYPTS